MVKKTESIITSITQLSKDIYSMWIKQEDISTCAKPGQFVNLFCKNGVRILPRPISICEIDLASKTIRLVYRVVGEGTKEFSNWKVGDFISIMGPLGNGFTLEGKKALLMGGGIGIPPMLELAKVLSCEKQIVLGYRDSLFLEEEFKQYGTIYISTEDGSAGVKGNVLDVVREKNLQADIIFACGPKPMLRGIKKYALEHQIKAQLSMEERMACGIGACLACVCNSTQTDEHTKVKNKRVCKDGPVFYAEEIEL